ncbi:hypothetical protein HaLaN_32699, partial [Haematococcus lacustris]
MAASMYGKRPSASWVGASRRLSNSCSTC